MLLRIIDQLFWVILFPRLFPKLSLTDWVLLCDVIFSPNQFSFINGRQIQDCIVATLYCMNIMG